MNRIARIIQLVDAAIKAGIGEWTTKAFGYAEQINPDSDTSRGQQQTRLVLSNNGLDKYDLTLNDTEDVIWYHRVDNGTSINYEQSDTDGFGDSKQTTESVVMRLVVWTDTRRTHYTNYQLADVFNRLISIQFAKAELTAMSLKTLSLFVDNANVNSSEVLSQEFAGITNKLGIERKFIALTYTVQMKYDSNCNLFNPCEPEIDCVPQPIP